MQLTSQVHRDSWKPSDFVVALLRVVSFIVQGRMRWKIENEGFNTQKRKGYNLEHQYSKDYQAQKCHYYLIQIGHMISQIMEAWEKLWKGIRQSREQKHRRILESFKEASLKEKTVEHLSLCLCGSHQISFIPDICIMIHNSNKIMK